MFTQRLNILTGEAEWVHVEAQGDGDPEDDSSDLVASSSYLDMLSDSFRNSAYRLALEAVVKPGSHVLDIGTGTGLLAMMAALLVRDRGVTGGGAADAEGRVTACEVFPPMASLAKRTIASNSLDNVVSVVAKRSSDLVVAQGDAHTEAADMPSGKADVIVTEIFDSELLGEGLLPTLRHAVPTLLKAGGVVVPSRARCFLQVVESTFLASCSPYSGSAPSHREDQAPLQTMKELHMAPLVAAADLRALTPPVEMLSFDLARPPLNDRRESCQVVAVRAGRAEAIVFWWQLAMDAEGTLLLSTAPPWITDVAEGADGGPREWGAQGWRDHWKTCWCAVGPQPFQVKQGDALVIAAQHSEINVTSAAWPRSAASAASLSVGSVDSDAPPADALQWREGERDSFGSAADSASNAVGAIVSHVELAASSVSRIYCLKDTARWSCFAKSIESAAAAARAASHGGSMLPLNCAVLGDSTPLASIAARLLGPSSQVTVLVDGSHGGHHFLTQFLTGGGRESLRVMSQSLKPFLLRAQHSATKSHERQQPFDLVVSEPYYRSCEGLLPWAALRFWHEVDTLRSSGLLSPSASIIPAKACLYGVGVSVPELWRTRLALSEVEGIDLSIANPLLGVVGIAHSRPSRRLPILPVSAWQCGPGYAELTDRVKLLEFPFLEPVRSMEVDCRAEVVSSGDCHGLLLYMEFHIGSGEGEEEVLNGAPDGQAPSVSVQGLQLLSRALQLTAPDRSGADFRQGSHTCRIHVSWDATDGTLKAWMDPRPGQAE